MLIYLMCFKFFEFFCKCVIIFTKHLQCLFLNNHVYVFIIQIYVSIYSKNVDFFVIINHHENEIEMKKK